MARPDETSRKLHPSLRVIKNCDGAINSHRADGSGRVASAVSTDYQGVEPAPIHEQLAQQAAMPRLSAKIDCPKGRLPKRGKLKDGRSGDNTYVNVFIEFVPGAQGDGETTQTAAEQVAGEIRRVLKDAPETIAGAVVERRNFLCATIPVPMLNELAENPAISFIHRADGLSLDQPQVTSVPPQTTPRPKAIGSATKHGRGAGVIVGIIDVEGFDFSHPDFLDANGQTRFLAIWDQGGDFRPPPATFDYGSEFRKPQLDAAIAAAKLPGMPPAPWIERQSQLEPASHGTHVASIAAGNSGVCPEAQIAAVLIDVPAIHDEVERRRSTFSDTSRITHAVEYLLKVAQEADLPIVINISLGTNGGSHDGASGVSRWLDAYLAEPGRAICLAAGNAGQDRPMSDGDLGWVMGRIHTSGRIPARGLEVELDWTVIGDGIEDWSENELEIWYSAQDRFAVALKPPGGDWIRVEPREFVLNRRLPSGVTVSIHNELYHPTNGCNYIALYLTPNYGQASFRGIDPGVWKVRLIGDEVRDGRFDAWIERDDPMEIRRDTGRFIFRFPSFFSERTNVDSHSITTLACGHRVIAVANLDEAKQQINHSSSQGPTRDGRSKPEIAASGTNVVAANGFGDPAEPWVSMTGTSMASPYVAGVVALMLAKKRELTAAQCAGILQRTARPLAGSSYEWQNTAGFGCIHPEAAIEEAESANVRKEKRP